MLDFQFRELEVQSVSVYQGKLHNVVILRVYLSKNKRTRTRFLMSVVLDSDHVEIVGERTIRTGCVVSGHGYITDQERTRAFNEVHISIKRIKIERRC